MDGFCLDPVASYLFLRFVNFLANPFIRNWEGRTVDIRPLLPTDVKDMLKNIEVSDEEDRMYWVLNEHGDFSTAFYWEHFRIKHEESKWSGYFWNKYIPTKVGAFLWRLSLNVIPVDSRISQMGFRMASKCRCCRYPQRETEVHLFLFSDLANAVWTHFANNFKLINSYNSLDHLAEIWLNGVSTNSKVGISRNFVFASCL